MGQTASEEDFYWALGASVRVFIWFCVVRTLSSLFDAFLEARDRVEFEERIEERIKHLEALEKVHKNRQDSETMGIGEITSEDIHC